jgi:hypothetical protein
MKEMEMKRRNNWIIIIGICVACGLAWVVYDVGYGTIRIFREQRWMDSRRPVLLYQTDHQALLEACTELSKQVAAGELRTGQYRGYSQIGNPDPETQLFPQPILDLKPMLVYIGKNRQVNLIMSPTVAYGVRAHCNRFKRDDIELVPGLWYFDEDFEMHPEHKKEVEELLKKRKAGDSSGVP